MSKDEQAIQALQYLLDEGFIAAGYRDGEPALFLTTNIQEVHNTLRQRFAKQDEADWWKK